MNMHVLYETQLTFQGRRIHVAQCGEGTDGQRCGSEADGYEDREALPALSCEHACPLCAFQSAKWRYAVDGRTVYLYDDLLSCDVFRIWLFLVRHFDGFGVQ